MTTSEAYLIASLKARLDEEEAAALREVATKRAILELYEKQAAKAGDNAMEEDRAWTLWPVVALLASGYETEPHRTGDGERDMWTIAAWLPRGREAEVAKWMAARGIEVYRMWQPNTGNEAQG